MKHKCVIDIGSNTIKLFIAKITDDNNIIIPIETKRRMARLGKNISKTNKLAEDSKELAITFIEEYLNISNSYNISPENILITATAACRNASDGQKFINHIKNKFKLINIKILSGHEEAKYNFFGVLEDIIIEKDLLYCVLDVGGGSFQLSIGNRDKFITGISIQNGCNSATEQFGLNQKVSLYRLKEAIEFFKNIEIKGLTTNINSAKLVGIGGTLKIMQLMLNNEYDYTPLTINDLIVTAEHLASKTVKERYEWFQSKYNDENFRIDAGLTINRAEVFLAGLCILIGILEKLSTKEVLLSKTDAKDYIIKLNSFEEVSSSALK